MANYENIEPYSKFSHTAAQHGGVDNYLNDYAQKNYERGVLDEKETEPWKGVIVAIIAIGVWEGARWCYHKLKNRLDSQRETIEVEIEEAKEQIIQNSENLTDITLDMFSDAVRDVCNKYRDVIHAEAYSINGEGPDGYICCVEFKNKGNDNRWSEQFVFNKKTGKLVTSEKGVPDEFNKRNLMFVRKVEDTLRAMRETKEESETEGTCNE